MKYMFLVLKYIQLISFIFINFFSVSGQNQTGDGEKLSLLFIGDIMGHDDQIIAAEDTLMHTYDYNDVFRYIKPLISEADIAIANLEVTLAGPPYKGYPRFSSPVELAVACINAGIDCLVTSNNHLADRGETGIISTIRNLDSIGVAHTGTYINSEQRNTLSPLLIKNKDASIALLSYTYGTNGMEISEPGMVNNLNKELVSEDVINAKKHNSDLLILFLHWGTEYDTVPSKEQVDLASYFFSLGVDMIIGSHPHVLQKMVWTKSASDGKDNLVVYSLGNFVSNQRKLKTDGGSMVRVELSRTDGRFAITDAGYYLTWVYTPVENQKKRYYILPCTEFENKPDYFSNPDDYNQMKKFISDSRKLLNIQNIGIKEIRNN